MVEFMANLLCSFGLTKTLDFILRFEVIFNIVEVEPVEVTVIA